MKKRPFLHKTMILLFWLLLWQLLALFVDNPVLMVTPGQAFGAFLSLAGKGSFWRICGTSFFRIGTGFLAGTAAALLLSALSFRFPVVEEVLQPFMTLCKSVPVASFAVLFLIWWGSSALAAVICLLVVLPNLYLSTLEGLKTTEKELLEMAKVFRLPLKTRFFYIYRPALRPFLYSSLKLSLGMCWKSGVAAEVIGTPDYSIGGALYLSKIYLDTAGIFAWTAVVIILSVLFERIVLWGLKCFFMWEPVCQGSKEGFPLRKEALVVQGLTKAYGSQIVLQALDARYEPGQTYYLTSPSGSGKTTLLRLLSGLELPDQGMIAPRLTCSFLFQEDRLCEEYSAIRNLELVVGDRSRARNVLEELLPPDSLDKPCRELSGGMKRRVALARAMEASSQCVLLDEPYTGLDQETRKQVKDYIDRRKEGRILIVATHIDT